MAFIVTALGTASSSVTPTTLSVAITSNCPVGAALIAVANESSASTLGSMAVAGGIGGSFVNLAAKQPNNANGNVSVWSIDKTNAQINSGTNVTWTNTAANHCALSVFCIQGTDGNPVVVSATPTAGSGASPLIPSSGSIIVPPSTLVLGIAGANAGSATTWTQDVNYTNAVALINTGLNSPGIICGYRVDAAGAETYNPTPLSGTKSWASFLFAYKALVPFIPLNDWDGSALVPRRVRSIGYR